MTAIRSDTAPKSPSTFPDTGLGKGWEAPALTTITLLLVSFGLVNLYSASAFLARQQGLPDTYFVLRQAMGAAVGLVALAACSRIPHGWWRHAAWSMVLVAITLLVLVILPWTTGIAPEINGARRWLDLGVSFQPSEIAKLALVVWTAHLAVKKRNQFRSFSTGMLPFLIVWAVLLIPILLQPDLSTALVLGAAGVLILFAAGGRVGHFVFLGLLTSPVLLAMLGSGFRRDRLLAFQDVDAFATGAGYQVHQSLISLGSGGIAGVGFGEGRQKFGFLPEPHNDFIFSMIGEEWGLVGVTFIVSLYMGVLLIGFRIARRAPDLFGQLLAIGVTSLIGLHAVLHMAVGLGLVPPTGLSLPLVSYGRSNLLVMLIAVGILLSIARKPVAPGEQAR